MASRLRFWETGELCQWLLHIGVPALQAKADRACCQLLVAMCFLGNFANCMS